MMLNPKLSLVIAMYNIRDYIGECVKSCLNQVGVEDNDYEIIIVNDGSTDDSSLVAEHIIEGHNNAHIIKKPNGGLSDARNFGLEHANGDYVWYIDGDDIIDQNAVKTIIEATKSEAQVYMINYEELYPDGLHKKIEFDSSRLPSVSFNANELIANNKMSFPPMMAWLQIQKRSFIKENELSFLKDAKSEDLEYTAKLFAVANKVVHIPSTLYVYRQNRTGSIIQNLNNDSYWIQNLLNICISVSDYMKKMCIKDSYKNKILAVLSSTVIFYLFKQDYDNYKKSRILINKSKLNLYEMLKNGKANKFIIKAFVYKYVPYKFAKLFFK